MPGSDERLADLRRGAEKAGPYVAIKRDDLLWLLERAEAQPVTEKSNPEEPTA